MADELRALGLDYTDEDTVRAQVAADLEAKTTGTALAEEEKIRKAMKNLQRVETEYQDLQIQLINDGVGETKKEYLLAQKAQVIETAAEAVEKAQLEAEAARQQRLKTINQRQKQEMEAEQKRLKQLKEEQQGQAIPASIAARTTTIKKEEKEKHPLEDLLGMPDPALECDGVAGPGVVQPRGHTRRATAGVNPVHVRGETAETDAVADYRGGKLLNPVNQVVATSRDAHRQRARDDGNAGNWEERKRARDAEEEGKAEDELVVKFSPTIKIDKSTWENLFDYQQKCITWLLNLHNKNVGGILGDEMGLGKTIQISAFLNLLENSQMLNGPVLIVAPLTVLSQWVEELQKWCPKLRAQMFHSSGSAKESKVDQIKEIRQEYKKVDKSDIVQRIVVTTYMGMSQNCSLLQSATFDYIILDEGHKISNPEAGITVAAKTFSTKHRIILSGSPIQNSLKELWCLFDFVVPGLLGNLNNFVTSFEDPIKASRNPKATSLELATAVECAKSLRAFIAPYLLRRLKKEVNAALPPKNERVVRCVLTDSQLEKYTALLCSEDVQKFLSRPARMRNEFGGYIDRNGRAPDGGLVSGVAANASFLTPGMRNEAFKMLSQLRLLSNHVDLHNVKHDDEAEGGTGKGISFRSNNPVDLTGSGKLAALQKMLQQWKEGGHKVLVFSQFRMMLDIIENLVEQEGYKYIRMDGTTASTHRQVLIDTFNKDESVFCALMTTKVGGLGVNLTGADRVVIFDPDWNPVTDEQARERAWRIGQTREVCVYRMITAGTVEEHILHKQLAKNYVTEKVLKDPTVQRFYSVNNLTEQFLLGSEYAERVPMKVRYSVCAASINRGNIGHEVEATIQQESADEALRAAAGEEFKIEDSADQEPAVRRAKKPQTPLGAAAAAGTTTSSTTTAGGYTTSGVVVKQEGQEDGLAGLMQQGHGRGVDVLTRAMAQQTAQSTLRRAVSSKKSN